MTTTTVSRPDTHQMVVGHRVFRREFRLLPGLIGAVPPGDTARAGVVAEHATDVTIALHAHHSSEDDVLWPRLLERAGLHADLVHRMEQQHDEVGGHLDRIESLLETWAERADPAERDALATTFAATSAVLEEHLHQEESEILPLVATHLNGAEWGELGERMHAAMPRHRMLKFFGMVLEDATPEEQRRMMSAVPLRARAVWRLVGRRKYQGIMRSVRGA